MDDNVRFDKWWGIVIGLISVSFVGWFVLTEFDGLLTFVEYLANAVIYTPQSLQKIVDYYATLQTSPLLASLLIGGVFGAIATVLIIINANKIVGRIQIQRSTLALGVLVGFGAYLTGANVLDALYITILATIISAFVLQDDMRGLLSVATLKRLTEVNTVKVMGRGLAFGSIAGAIGSQVFAYPMQHCTFLPDAESVPRQIGNIVTIVSASVVLIPLWTWMLRRSAPRNLGTSGFFRGWALPFSFLFPTLISLAVFLYYPAMQVATLSLNAQRFRQERFVCLDNYISIANDSVYQNSFIVTLVLMAAIVVFSMALALSIALLASQKVKGASIYRTLLIWPYALSPVVVGVIFLGMFRQGRVGLVNYALSELTGETLNWFTDPSLAPWVIIFASVYNALGFNILFYIAGLQNVPKDLLEAAEIDGANRVQRFFRITFPLLSPFTFFLLVTNVTYAFYGIYGSVDTLTQGGPPLGLAGQDGGATDVLIYKLYEDAFASGAQIGGAAAQSIVLFMLVAGITILQFRYLETRVTYAD